MDLLIQRPLCLLSDNSGRVIIYHFGRVFNHIPLPQLEIQFFQNKYSMIRRKAHMTSSSHFVKFSDEEVDHPLAPEGSPFNCRKF